MNVPASNSKSITCPICKRASRLSPVGTLNGLFICLHCRSNFVISWSGHYVRDPYPFNASIARQISAGRIARKSNHNKSVNNKIRRDLIISKRLRLLTIIGSILIVSLAIIVVDQSKAPKNLWQQFQEWIVGEPRSD